MMWVECGPDEEVPRVISAKTADIYGLLKEPVISKQKIATSAMYPFVYTFSFYSVNVINKQ